MYAHAQRRRDIDDDVEPGRRLSEFSSIDQFAVDTRTLG